MRKELKIELLIYAATVIVAVFLSAVYHLPKIAYILSFAGYPLIRYKYGKPAILSPEGKIEASQVMGNTKELSIYRGSKLFESVISAETPPTEFRIPVAIGLNYKGTLIWADMTQVLSCLIAGLQGMGKSNFLEGLIQSTMYFKPQKTVYLMADFKKLGLVDYKNFKNTVFTSDYLELNNLLLKAIDIMEKRIELFIENNGRKACKNINDWQGEELPWLFIIIDEVADISDSDEYGEQLWDNLGALLRKGRAVGIIVILATQRPTVTSIPGKIAALLDSRFVMRVKNARESSYCHVENAHLLKNPGEMVVESRVFNGFIKTLELRDSDTIFDGCQEATSKPSNSQYDLINELTSGLSGKKVILAKNEGKPGSPIEEFKSLLKAEKVTYELPDNKLLMERLGLSKWQLDQLKAEAREQGIIKKIGKTKHVLGDL